MCRIPTELVLIAPVRANLGSPKHIAYFLYSSVPGAGTDLATRSGGVSNTSHTRGPVDPWTTAIRAYNAGRRHGIRSP